MSDQEIKDAKEIARLVKYVNQLENWIINSTRKRPSTALDFLDDKADVIKKNSRLEGRK